MDADSDVLSSQSSIFEQENVAPYGQSSSQSSPVKQTRSGQKPSRPPTVTPKRFSRFFTPRSSLSAAGGRSKSSRRFKDITNQAVNRQPIENAEFPSLRAHKRRKYSVDLYSSPPQSSPIKCAEEVPLEHTTHLEEELSEEEEANDHPPALVSKIGHTTLSQRLLARSFGGRITLSRGSAGIDNCAPIYTSTANYCSGPQDAIDLRRSSLGFCTAACNSNSMIAIGDESGEIHMLDTASTADFTRPHLSFRVHRNAVMDLTFSPCDYFLATAGGDQTARIIDMHTQRAVSVLSGHRATIRQVRFRPDDPKLVTTSGRDGTVNVWDLRCSQRATQTIKVGNAAHPPPPSLSPYASMFVGPAHRATTASEQLDTMHEAETFRAGWSVCGVSITSIEHLPGSRSHLLLSASEQNASLKLFDLRVAGRNTKSDKFGFEVPLACTPTPSTQARNYGVSSLVLSTDGSRAYSICKDNTVWVYSTQHLIMGSALETANYTKRTRILPPEKPREGLGPLYGLRHPSMKIGSFYVKAAMRKASPEHEELLAVGSQDCCAVLFPTDERKLRLQHSADATNRKVSRLSWAAQSSENIYESAGTALVRGHDKEVTAVAFSYDGDLVTLSDDFKARCWRQDAPLAQQLRQCGEGQGNRWGCGWADVPSGYDEEDV